MSFGPGTFAGQYGQRNSMSYTGELPIHGSFAKAKKGFFGARNPSKQSLHNPLNEGGDTATRPTTAATTSHKKRESSVSSLADLASPFRRRSSSIRSERGHERPSASAETASSNTSKSKSALNLRATTTNQGSRSKPGDTNQIPTPSTEQNGQPPALMSLNRQDTSRPPTAGAIRDAQGRSLSASTGSNSASVQGRIHNVQELTSKRIATLDYLMRMHKGNVYWINTAHFDRRELSKLPYFDPLKLARRANNFMVLLISIPAVLEPNKHSIFEYLKMLSSLLNEFEAYQALHPVDGSAGGSMLSRVPGGKFLRKATGPPRRGSAVDWMGAAGPEFVDSRSFSGPAAAAGGTPTSPYPGTERDAAAGKEFHLLLTPHLPFDTDYYETFATLCETFIECYRNIADKASPESCTSGFQDLVQRVDGKIREIVIRGLVKELEDVSKAKMRSELAGVGRVVLAGIS